MGPTSAYTKVWAFLSLVGHYRRFIKGFVCITQPPSEYLTGQGAGKKSEWGSLTKDAMKAFEALKEACMTAPILVFADYTKPFLLETDASKDGLGAVLSQKQADGLYQQVAYGSRDLMLHEKNYHSTKLEFFWHWSGQLQRTLKSICPTGDLLCGQIIIHSSM